MQNGAAEGGRRELAVKVMRGLLLGSETQTHCVQEHVPNFVCKGPDGKHLRL